MISHFFVRQKRSRLFLKFRKTRAYKQKQRRNDGFCAPSQNRRSTLQFDVRKMRTTIEGAHHSRVLASQLIGILYAMIRTAVVVDTHLQTISIVRDNFAAHFYRGSVGTSFAATRGMRALSTSPVYRSCCIHTTFIDIMQLL